MNFNKKKLIRAEDIVEVVKGNFLYNWELRILGCEEFIGVMEDLNGNRIWYKKGKWHRLDGPAVENSDGTKYWYIENKEYSSLKFERKRVNFEF